MTTHRLDVLAIGNAIVDVIADANDAFVARAGHAQGLDAADRRGRGDAALRGDGRRRARLSGGSAANTVAGLAALGLKAGFIGQLADDQLGADLHPRHPQPRGRVRHAAARATSAPPARCLILVTPDAQRTMNTFLGAAQMLEPRRGRPEAQSREREDRLSRRLSVGPGGAARGDACGDGRGARGRDQGRLHSVRQLRRRPPPRRLRALLDEGRIDILFANEAEILQLAGADDFDEAVDSDRRPRCRPWSSPAASRARSRVRGGERAEVAGRADRAAGRHDRRRRPVRRGLPRRRSARARARAVAASSARSPRPKSSSIMAPGPRPTSRRSPATCSHKKRAAP